MQTKDLEYEFQHFSYSNHTSCINLHNINWIEQNIIKIFEQEECQYILRPPLPQNHQPLIQKLRSSPLEMKSCLGIIGLFEGNSGWTVIKTEPSELFCRKAKNTSFPLLAKLARQTKCNAFHHTVADREWGVLLEVSNSGKTFASGYLESDYIKYMKFYTEDIRKPRENKNFLLLNVSEEFQKAGRVAIRLNQEEKQAREEELELLYQSNEKELRKQAWDEWKELNMSWFERVDEDLGKIICKSDAFWHENNLLYKAFAEPEKLEKDGVRLLFFQVGQFHLNPNTEEIWSPITSREDYGKDPWQEIPF
jgi:hypothetical protein